MSVRDFLLLMMVCVLWGSSNVVSRIVVGMWGVPPLFFAAVRFAVVLACTAPWLLPVPRPLWRIVVVGLCMGAGSFALLFIGLQTATASASAIVGQLAVPFTTLLSIIILHERIHWRRGLGIALTLAGVLIVVWKPGGLGLSAGLWFVAAAAFAGSLGAILMKQMSGIAPLRFQAWVALSSLAPLTLLSALIEHNQWGGAVAAGWPFVGALLFAALGVSVVAHTTYYALIGRYEANLVAPLTLMTPLSAIGFGALLTGDQLDAQMIVGSVLALIGVLIVARRPKPTSELMLLNERP